MRRETSETQQDEKSIGRLWKTARQQSQWTGYYVRDPQRGKEIAASSRICVAGERIGCECDRLLPSYLKRHGLSCSFGLTFCSSGGSRIYSANVAVSRVL
jgi:hypothetical protein